MTVVTLSYKLVTSNTSRVNTSGASTSSGSGQGTARLIGRGSNLGNRTGQTYKLGDKAASEKAKQGAAARASDRGRAKDEPVNTVAEQATETNSQTPVNDYQPIASAVGGGTIIQDKRTQEIFSPVSTPVSQYAPTTYSRIYAPPMISPRVQRALEEARREDANTIKNINVDTSTNNQVLLSLRKGAAKTAIFLEQSGQQGSAIAKDERSSNNLFQRAVSYPTSAIAYGATAVSQPLRQFAESDKELGKQITLGYAGGKAIGVVAGALPNYAAGEIVGLKYGNSLVPSLGKGAGKYGAGAAAKAYASTNLAITGVGVAATGLTVYGQSAEDFGKTIPSLVVGGFAAKSAFDLGGRQGVQVTGIKPVGSSKPVFKGTPESFGVYTKNLNVAEVSVYGKPIEVPFTSVTSVAGGKLPSGKFAIDATTYGNVNVAGKNFGFSDTYSGYQTGRSLGIRDVKTGNVFSAISSKPKLLIEDQQGTNIGENIYSTKTKFALTTAKGEPLSAGYSKTLSSQYEYTNVELFKFKAGKIVAKQDIVTTPEFFAEQRPVVTFSDRPNYQGYVNRRQAPIFVNEEIIGVPKLSQRVIRHEAGHIIDYNNIVAGKKSMGIPKELSGEYVKLTEKGLLRPIGKSYAADKVSNEQYAELYKLYKSDPASLRVESPSSFKFIQDQATKESLLLVRSGQSQLTLYPREGFVGQGVTVTVQRQGVPVVDPRVVRAGNKALGIPESPPKSSFKLEVPKIVGKKGSLYSPELVSEVPSVISKPVIVSEPFSIPDIGGLNLRVPTTKSYFFGGISAGAVNTFIQPSSVSKSISLSQINNRESSVISVPSTKPVSIQDVERISVQTPKFIFNYAQATDSKSITTQKYLPSPSLISGSPSRPIPFYFPPLSIPSGGLGGGYGREGRGSKQKYAYTPSLTGIEKRVVGTGKATGNTGISVRGVSKKQLAILEGHGKSFVRF